MGRCIECEFDEATVKQVGDAGGVPGTQPPPAAMRSGVIGSVSGFPGFASTGADATSEPFTLSLSGISTCVSEMGMRFRESSGLV